MPFGGKWREGDRQFDGGLRLLTRRKPLGKLYTRIFTFTYYKLALCRIRVTVSSVLAWWFLELPLTLLEIIMVVLEFFAHYRKY